MGNPIKGKLLDSDTRRPVGNALIILKTTNTHTISDSSGIFSLNINTFPAILEISHVSYEFAEYPLNQYTSNEITILLIPKTEQLESLVFVHKNKKEEELALKKINWGKAKISKLTSGFGEPDIIRSLQVLPGIQKSSEINASLNVRGSGHGNNRISLDGLPIYNSYHLLGIAPMFNAEVINKVDLYKSGFPASKGGYLASYLDIESRAPSMEDKKLIFGIGNLSSKILFEGPVVKDKIGILFSARYAFFDMISNIYEELHQDREDFISLPDYQFYDINLVSDISLPKYFKLRVSFFHNTDNFAYAPSALKLESKWANDLLSLSLSRSINKNTFIRFTSGLSFYSFNGKYNPSWIIKRTNNITSFENQLFLSYKPSGNWSIETGTFLQHNNYYLNNKEMYPSSIIREATFTPVSLLWGFYAESNFRFTKQLSFIAGNRFNFYSFDQTIFCPSPRIQFNYSGNSVGINMSYDETWQFNHLIAPLGFNIPADLWIPADKNIPPQKARQIALHFNHHHSNFKTGAGIFYKQFKNLSELKNGAELVELEPAEELTFGTGFAYGFETSGTYKNKLLEIELNYTYSNSKRKFSEINNGQVFSPSYDIPHKFDAVFSIDITKNITTNITWFWASGSITTMPTGFIFIPHSANSNPYPLYSERNNFRMPATHRLDIATVFSKNHSWGNSQLAIGIYNAYNQTNPYFLFFILRTDEHDEVSVIPQQLGIFPCTPFINFKVELK
ncbi:MAG: carboxypeptidase-like regulatory domain-containing protein [Bacteroidales bacterium]|nr:carboxypeptidase-like regulatory domain-containing protein [Bacteroidales bacterium]